MGANPGACMRACSIPFPGAIMSATPSRGCTRFHRRQRLSLVRRLAGAAFLIRVVSAALTFVSQILLARWMGGYEFGIYIYGWTWILLVGGMVDLGLGLGGAALHSRIYRA